MVGYSQITILCIAYTKQMNSLVETELMESMNGIKKKKKSTFWGKKKEILKSNWF